MYSQGCGGSSPFDGTRKFRVRDPAHGAGFFAFGLLREMRFCGLCHRDGITCGKSPLLAQRTREKWSTRLVPQSCSTPKIISSNLSIGSAYWFCSGGGVGVLVWTPSASKIRVRTSASAPWAGISLPFQRKLMPAALPVFTVISRVARTEVWAGAMRVSWVTSWPSTRTEIQEFSEARMIRVSGAGDAESAGATAFCAPSVGLLVATGFAAVERSAVGDGTTKDGCVPEVERAATAWLECALAD